MQLIPPIYPHERRHVRQEYKDAPRLAEGRLNECEVKKMHRPEKHFYTLMREKSLPLRWVQGRRSMKRGFSPLVELQLLKVATTTLARSHYSR